MNELFKHYIAELGQHSAISWLIIACLVALNYFRIAVIDPTVAGSGCHNFLKLTVNTVSATPTSTHRLLGSASGSSSSATDEFSGQDTSSVTTPNDCVTYMLLYSYICASILTLMGLVIYYCAIRYEKRLLQCSLKADGIDNHKNLRYSFVNSLQLMIRRERMIAYAEKVDPGAGVAGGLSARKHHHKGPILGGSQKSTMSRSLSLYDLLPQGESPSPRKGGGRDERSIPTISMTPERATIPMSPLGKYPIPTAPAVTLDILDGSETSTGRGSMRNKMIALPPGTLSRVQKGTLSHAQKEPSDSGKVNVAPAPWSETSISRDLLGQGPAYGDVECGTTEQSSEYRDSNPIPSHFTDTIIDVISWNDSNKHTFEVHERCERKEVLLDSVEDPKIYRDNEVC